MIIRGIFLIVAAAGTANAQDLDLQGGRDLYRTYCSQCHGIDATGNGPMAEMLAIETPDLTTLATRNGAEFPTEAAARQIDGRWPLLAHGGEMPIFGPVLESDQHIAPALPNGQPMMTSLPLANLIAYLESVQVE